MGIGFWCRVVCAVFFLAVEGRGASASASWSGHGPVSFRATLPLAREGRWEPLLASGTPGAGDVVFCRRLADDRLVFGWEQIGRPAAISEPVAMPGSEPAEILISLGSQLPKESDLPETVKSMHAMFREHVLVQCRGRTVLLAKGEFTSTTAAGVLGRNTVGGAFARPFYSGHITGAVLANFETLVAAIAAPGSLIAQESPEENRPVAEFPGPLRLKLMFPGGGAGHNEPLVVTGVTGAGDLIYVRYVDERHLRIGFDHWMVGGPLSEPLECDVTLPHDVVVSMGSMLPQPVDGTPDKPEIAALRRRCVVMLDGKVVINTPAEFHPTKPAQLTLFTNRIGGSTANPVFTGSILQVLRVSPQEILSVAP